MEAVRSRIDAPEQRLIDAGDKETQHNQIKTPKAKERLKNGRTLKRHEIKLHRTVENASPSFMS